MSIGWFDQFKLLHFAKDRNYPKRWSVTVYRTRNGVPSEVVDAFMIEEDEGFLADQLWCDAGPGQEFLWGDYPDSFQKVLRTYAPVNEPRKPSRTNPFIR